MVAITLGAGLLLSSISSLPYLRDVTKGRARPRLVSWGIWSVLLSAMTYIAVREGQVASAVLSMVSAIGCAAIVVTGWAHGSRTFSRLDVIALLGAVLGIATLFVQQDAVLSLAIMLAVDTVAYVPTLLHAWSDPDEESTTSWVLSAVGSVLTLAAAAMTNASMTGLLYPAYSATFGILMVALLVIGRVRGIDALYQTDSAD
jgi:hypothetical protein